MKRLVWILLIVLLLTGCAAEKPEPITDSDVDTAEPAGLYVPETVIEKQTAGAVRVYSLADSTYDEVNMMGAHLLLAEDQKLLVLTGEKAKPTAQWSPGANMPISCIDVDITGVGFFIPNTRQVEILNPQLQTVVKLTLPETLVGEPVICLKQNLVYYTTESEIYALDIRTGISRLVRQQSVASRVRLGSFFDGSMLACYFEDENGTQHTEYISAQTGQICSDDQRIALLESYADTYCGFFTDGQKQKLIFGALENDAQVISFPQQDDARSFGQIPVLEMNGMLFYGQTDSELTLSFLDLETGKCTANTVLDGIGVPISVCSDGEYVWLLCADAEGEQFVFRWDISMSSVSDEQCYTRMLYTENRPDIEGLSDCAVLAETVANRHGITLSIWQDALTCAGTYSVKPEHDTEVLQTMLAQIDSTLQLFPEGMLEKTVAGKSISIALVRNIADAQEAVQYWTEKTCYLLLSSEADPMQALCYGIAQAMDSHILGNSRDFDSWNQLNPKEFSYGDSQQNAENDPYLSGEGQAFVDAYAMADPREDRCRTFMYAMRSGSEELFASPMLQEKLLRLCMGIREAYGLEEMLEVLIWERYLKTPIAPVEG